MTGARSGRLLLFLPAILAPLLACSSAGAATVTVGSPLTASFAPVSFTPPGALAINSELGEVQAVAASPVDGAVIGWKAFGEGSSLELRILRPEGAGSFLATGASAPQALASYGLGTFTTDLPIRTGEIIGLEVGAGSSRIGIATGDAPGSVAETWEAAPGSSATPPNGGAPDSEIGFDATVLPAPTIVTLAPASGPAAGGTSVTVSGTDFSDVEGVAFGSVPAAAYSVGSAGQLTAVAPAGAPGAVPIRVTTVAGTASSALEFTYEAPSTTATAAARRCVVPKLKGKRVAAVRKRTKAAGCTLGNLTKKPGAGHGGVVVKQEPKPGSTRAAGSKIYVVLGGK